MESVYGISESAKRKRNAFLSAKIRKLNFSKWKTARDSRVSFRIRIVHGFACDYLANGNWVVCAGPNQV